jgi:myo-inositol 2-dehydrogenase/D-chiro-inositol 1-dehydrogenase
MSAQKVKIALIGAGGWGQQHGRIFAARQDVDFCAVVGRNPQKTRLRAEQYGVPYYVDIMEMIEKELPDLISLCLPNEGHFSATKQVIEAGIPLLVEKPLVFQLEEAEILLNAAAQRNLFFAINFNHRYATPVIKAKEAIEANKLGELIFATWRFGGEGFSNHPHANLIETQCHGFDMLEHLCGPIESIMAQMTNKTGKGYSTVVLSLQFANGAIGSLVGSYDSSYAYPQTHLVEVNGTKGRLTIEDTVRKFTLQNVGDETAQVWQAGYFNDVEREFHYTFDKHMDDLLLAFKQGKEPPIHASSGLRALKLAYAAIESFQTGKRISIVK